jgi:hypothetical protein
MCPKRIELDIFVTAAGAHWKSVRVHPRLELSSIGRNSSKIGVMSRSRKKGCRASGRETCATVMALNSAIVAGRGIRAGGGATAAFRYDSYENT